jgi:hypothetical protein
VLDSEGREIDRQTGSRDEIEAWRTTAYPEVPLRFVPTRNPRRLPASQSESAGKTGRVKETRNVTDRALRYRANAHPPPGPRICCLCGSQRNVEVGHANGHEEDSSPDNLLWTCRACNVRCGNALRRAGLGRLTRQYNPTSEGAPNLGAWMNAVLSVKGDPGGNMPVPDAVAMIHATSPEDRSDFAKEIWNRRRRRGTDRAVPF